MHIVAFLLFSLHLCFLLFFFSRVRFGPSLNSSIAFAACLKGYSCFADAVCGRDKCQCPSHLTGPHCEYDLALPELDMLSCNDWSFNYPKVDLTGLSWCRSANPTISPLRLPPHADPASIAFDVSPCSEELNPNATCKTVVKVSSLGWTKNGEANSFVLSGMLDGHFIIAGFTDDSVRLPLVDFSFSLPF
jgi:hypothetical protein